MFVGISIGTAGHAPLVDAASPKAGRNQKRLSPLPPEKEWWITANDNGRLLPVLTDPWWDRGLSGAVRDRATDLWWQGPAGLPDSAPASFQRAKKACEANGAMRLPTRHEMESIIDRYRSAPVIDPTIFPRLVSDFYWTQTPAASGLNWLVHLEDGRFVKGSTAESRQARFFCVMDMRASAPQPHYDVSARTIRDNATGLSWHAALTSADDLQGLASACAASTISNLQWRVPTIKELLTIMSPERPAPHIDPAFGDDRELASSTSADGVGGLRFQGVSYRTGERIGMEGTVTRCVSNGEPRRANADRVFKGNVEILNGYENGNLALQALEGRQLRSIEGNVLVQGLNSAALVLPYLESIRGDLVITGTQLEEIHLPHLVEVTGSITLEGNRVLRKVSMRSLAAVGKDLVVARNAALGSQQAPDDPGTIGSPLRMDSLRSIGGAMKIEYNGQLKALYWPALRTVGHQFVITENAALWWLQARAVVSIGSNCKSTGDSCGSIDVGGNQKLQALSLDSLTNVFGDVSIRSNGVFNDFANKVDAVGLGLYVEDNKSLCARDRIDPILHRAWSKGRFPGTVRIRGNDPAERCRTACPDREGNHCSIER